ncbi:HAMP domain-containing histidine kinase [Flavobacterium azooxidireducens]|uniref:histidine kinase n=1 Tax=Flavobacterium azooxidireducens TaxID=1871076 RepID=A0ABY4KBK7_9FLAO|nr:HAMP domain-containing sensor histidine kinase [Flavobacterium azooxidireducens]UPQ77711.1 HAMP domain-containing histidine kinase [Flavobacterium azooxidireducens]
MMKSITIISFIFFTAVLFGQNDGIKTIDSLKLILQTEKNIDSIIKINNTIAINIKNHISLDDAVTHLHKNVKFSKKHKREFGVGESYLILGHIYIIKAEHDSSSYYLTKSISIFKNSPLKNKLARAYYLKSIVYQMQSDFSNQLKYALLAQEFAEQSKDYTLITDSANALSMYYLDQHKYNEALVQAKKCVKYALLSKKENRINVSYMGIAETYRLLKDTVNANHFFEKSYKGTKANNQKFEIAWILTNWAKLKPNAEALQMRLEARDMWDQHQVNPMNIHNNGMIGILYLSMYDAESDSTKKINYLLNAEKHLTSTIEKAENINDLINLIELNKSLSRLYSIKKDYEKAFFYLEKSNLLNDSLNSQEIKNSLAKLESQKEIQLRDKEIQLNKLTLETKEKQKWIYIGGILLLGIIGSLLFYQSRNRQKTNQKLQLLNSELDQANKVKTRFFSILNHDLRSPVANLIHFLHLQKDNPELMDEATKNRMQNKTISGAENLLSSMEDILLWSKGQMENFKPEPKKVSVNQLFEDNKKVFSGYQNITFDYQNPDAVELFTDENYLKTIIRNLTSNAINVFTTTPKPTIICKAWQENGKSYLTISDNGPGASQEQFKALYDDKEVVGIKSGLGLHLIRDLAKAINCEIAVDSKLGEGTSFILTFDNSTKSQRNIL